MSGSGITDISPSAVILRAVFHLAKQVEDNRRICALPGGRTCARADTSATSTNQKMQRSLRHSAQGRLFVGNLRAAKVPLSQDDRSSCAGARTLTSYPGCAVSQPAKTKTAPADRCGGWPSRMRRV